MNYYVAKLALGLLDPAVPGRLRVPSMVTRQEKILVGLEDPFREAASQNGWRPAHELGWWSTPSPYEPTDVYETAAELPIWLRPSTVAQLEGAES